VQTQRNTLNGFDRRDKIATGKFRRHKNKPAVLLRFLSGIVGTKIAIREHRSLLPTDSTVSNSRFRQRFFTKAGAVIARGGGFAHKCDGTK
jgi:hypothetical protein